MTSHRATRILPPPRTQGSAGAQQRPSPLRTQGASALRTARTDRSHRACAPLHPPAQPRVRPHVATHHRACPA